MIAKRVVGDTLKRDVEEFLLNFKNGKITVAILHIVFYCTAKRKKTEKLSITQNMTSCIDFMYDIHHTHIHTYSSSEAKYFGRFVTNMPFTSQ